MDKRSIMMDIKDTTGQGSTRYKVYLDSSNEDERLKRKAQLLGTEQLCVLRTEPETDVIFAAPKSKYLLRQCPYCNNFSLTVHRKNIKHEYWTVGTDKNLHRVVLLRNYCRCNNANCDGKKEETKEKAVFPQMLQPYSSDNIHYLSKEGQFDVVAGRTSYGIKLIDEIGRQCLINTFSAVAESLQTADGTAPLSKSMVALAFRRWKSYLDDYRIKEIRKSTYKKIWIQTLTVNKPQGEEQSYVVFDLESQTILWIAQKKQANEPASDSDIIGFFEKIGREPFKTATIYIGLDDNLRKNLRQFFPRAEIIVPIDYVLLAVGETIATIIRSFRTQKTVREENIIKNITNRTLNAPSGTNKYRKIGFLSDYQFASIKKFWTSLQEEYPECSHEYDCIEEAKLLYSKKENLAKEWFHGNVYDAESSYKDLIELIHRDNRANEDYLFDLSTLLFDFSKEITASFGYNKRIGDPTLSDLKYLELYLLKTYGCSFDATFARIMYCAEIDDMTGQMNEDDLAFKEGNAKSNAIVFYFQSKPDICDENTDLTKVTIQKPLQYTLSETIRRLEKLDSDKKKEKKAKKNGQ